MKNLIIAGPPGSGKGTQAEKIAKQYNLLHISTGEVLRKAIKQKTPLGIIAQQRIDHGNFVPDEIALSIIKEYTEKFSNKVNGFIFDGFPRTLNQAVIFDSMLKEHKQELHAFILLYVDEKITIERMLKRAEKSNRADDANIDIIKHRIEVYHQLTEPIIEYYTQKGLLIEINGEKDVNTVFEGVLFKLNRIGL
ncbi:MAG: adenylate kinase [Bacteroidales bacterium]|nr:adenylate kinase [Bacteroidales bacterium]